MKKSNMENKKIIGISPIFPFLYNIKSGKSIQLKKLIKDGFSYDQAAIISEIVWLCSKRNQNKTKRNISGKFSFQQSLNVPRKKLWRDVKKITDKKNPPIFKIKKQQTIEFKINFKYFSKLYGKQIRTAKEILQHHYFCQDKFLINCLGRKEAFILSYLINKININIDKTSGNIPHFYIFFHLKDITKETNITYQSLQRILTKMAYNFPVDKLKTIQKTYNKNKITPSGIQEIIKNLPRGKENKEKILGILRHKKNILIYIDVKKIRKIQRDFIRKYDRNFIFSKDNFQEYFWENTPKNTLKNTLENALREIM